jgi:hypothetical protein
LGAAAVAWVRTQRSVPAVLGRTAQEWGIELEPGPADASLFSTEVHDSKFRLSGLPGAVGKVGRLSVEFSGLRPARVRADQIELTYRGDLLALFESWQAWQTQSSAARGQRLPIELGGLDWTLAHNWGPAMGLANVSSEPLKASTLVRTDRVTVGSLSFASLPLVIEPRKRGLDIGFGSSALDMAPVRLTYFATPAAETLNLSVRRASFGDLLARVGLSVKDEAVRSMLLLGSLSLVVPRDRQEIRASLQFTADDLPHPQLTDGLTLFGRSASLVLRCKMGRSLESWQAPLVVATLPPYVLEGNGRVDLEGQGARIRFDVSRRMDCDTLGRMLGASPTGARVRAALGTAAGASPADLGVRLQADLPAHRLDEARISWQIGPGCGLPVLAQDPLLDLSLPPFEPPARRGGVQPSSQGTP